MVGHPPHAGIRSSVCSVVWCVHHGPKVIPTSGGKRCLPHLSCVDSVSFRAWAQREAFQDRAWEYDVQVGRHSTAACERGDPDWEFYRGLLCKRVDALSRDPLPWIVVEVKSQLTMLALGQLLTYRHLLVDRWPQAADARLICVCTRGDPDLVRTFQDYGVEISVVVPPGSESATT